MSIGARSRPPIFVAGGLTSVCFAADQVTNGLVTVGPVVKDGKTLGFYLEKAGTKISEVLFGSVGNITADSVKQDGNKLVFTGLKANPTPVLGPGSYVSVELLTNDEFPRVRFRLELVKFEKSLWEGVLDKVPFHFMVCSMPGSEIFHQRGWPLGTPVVEPYVILTDPGSGRTIGSNFNRNWSYDPPIGAYPVPVAGLWNVKEKKYVAYLFQEARSTDNTEKSISTTYCWEFQTAKEFFCLASKYANGYMDLNYPKDGDILESHFRLIFNLNLPSDDDPNAFVLNYIHTTYADLIPGVPEINDMNWLPGNLRFKTPGRPSLSGLFHTVGEKDPFMKPGTIFSDGVSYIDPGIEFAYDTGKSTATLNSFKKKMEFLMEKAKKWKVGEDECVFWQLPIEGEWWPNFGKGVETMHNVWGVQEARAFLEVYKCEKDPKYLPYVDGTTRWLKHMLYTRNCYPDVTAAMFAWSGGPIVSYLLRYYYVFRDAPDVEHKALADLAYKLARSYAYRYLPIWTTDNDKADNLDSAFFCEPNAGVPWLGAACSNEVWINAYMAAVAYVATGDPLFGYYLRGMLERWHDLYKDLAKPKPQAYGSADLTERFGLYDGAPQVKGTRANYGGLWGGFEAICYPLAGSKMRVLCGEKAAMAFDQGGVETNFRDYRYYGSGNFSFTVASTLSEPCAVSITFPYFKLSGKPVYVINKGQKKALVEDTDFKVYKFSPDSMFVGGVSNGDIVAVGDWNPDVKPLSCSVGKTHKVEKQITIERDGYSAANIAKSCNTGIKEDWGDPGTMAGYVPGITFLWGVPFYLVPGSDNAGKVAVRNAVAKVDISCQRLFFLVSNPGPKALLSLTFADGSKQDLSVKDSICAITGWPPCFKWRIDLITVAAKGKALKEVKATDVSLFSVTGTQRSDKDIAEALSLIAAEAKKQDIEAKFVKKLEGLAGEFKRLSKRIAVIPVPQFSIEQVPAGALMRKAGVLGDVVVLTPEQLISKAFNGQRYPVAVYLGGEQYYQTVKDDGDADQAIINYLKTGGLLVVIPSPSQPFPFYYNEKGKPVVSAPKFGMTISGSGALDRQDTLKYSRVTGWEKPPVSNLTFRVNPKQDIIKGLLPETFAWMEDGDQRWRPMIGAVPAPGVYTPVVSLYDADNNCYGEGIAYLEYKSDPVAGGKIIYAWPSLANHEKYSGIIIPALLEYALKSIKLGN